MSGCGRTRRLIFAGVIWLVVLLSSLPTSAAEPCPTCRNVGASHPAQTTNEASGIAAPSGFFFGASRPTEDWHHAADSGSGGVLWARRYREAKAELDEGFDLARLANGSIVVTGLSIDPETGGDCAILGYSAGGGVQWRRRYDTGAGRWDECRALAVSEEGRIFVAGWTNAHLEFQDWLLIALDSSGQVLWDARLSSEDFGGYGNARAKAVVTGADGSVYVTGVAPFGEGGYDIVTVKLTELGEPLWTQRFSGPPHAWGDEPTAIAVDSQGNALVGGFSPNGRGNNDYLLVKYTAAGEEAWHRRRKGRGGGEDEIWALAVDAADSIYVTGDSPRRRGDSDVLTFKFLTNGHQAWKRRWDGRENSGDGGFAIAAHPAGGVAVAGTTWGGERAAGGGQWDFLTLRYGASGKLLWGEAFDASTWSESALSVAVSPAGEVVAAGGGWGLDYTLLKYDAGGTRLWAGYYDGAGRNSDIARKALILPDGSVAVTGLSVGARGHFDIATVAFSE